MNVVYFNVDLNNVTQCRNNVVIFNVDFHNIGQRRNNVVILPFEKNKKLSLEKKIKIMFFSLKYYAGLKVFSILFPILRGKCKRIFAEAQILKISDTLNYKNYNYIISLCKTSTGF